MTEQISPPRDIAMRLVRAMVDEVVAAAHDPATIHAVALRLHKGLDVLEKAMTEPEQKP